MKKYTVGQAVIKINKMLDTIYPNENERYPVDIDFLLKNAHELLKCEEKISLVEGAEIDGFEGSLFQADSNDWIVLFNSAIKSTQRIRFTKAHELGHYVLHRNLNTSFECSKEDLSSHKEKNIETEANEFSAGILMPTHDFRNYTKKPFSMELIDELCERYDTSLESVLLQWIKLTDENMVMIVSIDEFMRWAYSSRRAYRANAVFSTRKSVIEIPNNSVCKDVSIVNEYDGLSIPIKTWFPKAQTNAQLTEYKISQTSYDKTITILKLPMFEDVWVKKNQPNT